MERRFVLIMGHLINLNLIAFVKPNPLNEGMITISFCSDRVWIDLKIDFSDWVEFYEYAIREGSLVKYETYLAEKNHLYK